MPPLGSATDRHRDRDADGLDEATQIDADTIHALGIALSGSEIGLALTTRSRLLREQVLNLRKLSSREGKELAFRARVGEYLDRYGADRIALVAPGEHDSQGRLVEALSAWLRTEAAQRAIPLTVHSREELRAAFGSPGHPATHRSLAEYLACRFPSLASRVPERPPGRVGSVGRVTARELYWQPMFLALAAALFDLERTHQTSTLCPRRPPHRSV